MNFNSDYMNHKYVKKKVLYFMFKYDVDRSTTHPTFNPTGVEAMISRS